MTTIITILSTLLGAALIAIALLVRALKRPAGEAHQVEQGQRAEPPRTLPDTIATEADYDSLNTLPAAGPDPDAGDHELAQWLDTRAAEEAD
jgi:hypothetical protein